MVFHLRFRPTFESANNRARVMDPTAFFIYIIYLLVPTPPRRSKGASRLTLISECDFINIFFPALLTVKVHHLLTTRELGSTLTTCSASAEADSYHWLFPKEKQIYKRKEKKKKKRKRNKNKRGEANINNRLESVFTGIFSHVRIKTISAKYIENNHLSS